jgi:SAM-dependent methyltransferase
MRLHALSREARLSPLCRLYDGRRLPYADGFFATAGALNVLEHVEEPEAFLVELARVVRPGGRVVVSSPNFLRVLGPGYHPRMRGLRQRAANLRRLLAARRGPPRFDRMAPIVREPFQPDDDAIIATNGVEIARGLKAAGCAVERVDCTDRVVARPLDWLLNATPLRWAMFNAFVVARKRG